MKPGKAQKPPPVKANILVPRAPMIRPPGTEAMQLMIKGFLRGRVTP